MYISLNNHLNIVWPIEIKSLCALYENCELKILRNDRQYSFSFQVNLLNVNWARICATFSSQWFSIHYPTCRDRNGELCNFHMKTSSHNERGPEDIIRARKSRTGHSDAIRLRFVPQGVWERTFICDFILYVRVAFIYGHFSPCPINEARIFPMFSNSLSDCGKFPQVGEILEKDKRCRKTPLFKGLISRLRI